MIVNMIMDHASVDAAGVAVCSDVCMMCPFKGLVEAYLETPLAERTKKGKAIKVGKKKTVMGDAITQWLRGYIAWTKINDHNPIAIERIKDQADPKDVFEFLFGEWVDSMWGQLGFGN